MKTNHLPGLHTARLPRLRKAVFALLAISLLGAALPSTVSARDHRRSNSGRHRDRSGSVHGLRWGDILKRGEKSKSSKGSRASSSAEQDEGGNTGDGGLSKFLDFVKNGLEIRDEIRRRINGSGGE